MMNRLLGPPGPTPKMVLVDGRAPACWQRNLARSTARLDALRRACTWLEAPVAVRIRLRDEPLLGHCLAALTGQAARPAEPQPETSRPRRFRSARPEHATKRQRSMAPGRNWGAIASQSGDLKKPVTAKPPPQASDKQPSRRRAPAPLQLELETNRALLNRLAGETVLAADPNRPRRQRPREPLAPKARVSPSTSQESAARQDWLRDLARRAERSLRQDGLDPGPMPWRVSGRQLEPGLIPSLADQWAVSLKGRSASAALLAHLANLPVGLRNSSGHETQPWTASSHAPGARSPGQAVMPGAEAARPWTASPHIPGDRSPGQAVTPGVGAGQPRAVPDHFPVSRSLERSLTPAGGQDLAGSGLTGGATVGGSRTENAGVEPAPTARIAPPRVRPSLPPLLTPQLANEPPLTMATATVRQEARQETTAAGEDLNLLADRIKRILDEEARRHGINV